MFLDVGCGGGFAVYFGAGVKILKAEAAITLAPQIIGKVYYTYTYIHVHDHIKMVSECISLQLYIY